MPIPCVPQAKIVHKAVHIKTSCCLPTGSWDGTLRLWDLNSGNTTRRFIGHSKDVLSVAFSVDNRQVQCSAKLRPTQKDLWPMKTAAAASDAPLQHGWTLACFTCIQHSYCIRCSRGAHAAQSFVPKQEPRCPLCLMRIRTHHIPFVRKYMHCIAQAKHQFLTWNSSMIQHYFRRCF